PACRGPLRLRLLGEVEDHGEAGEPLRRLEDRSLRALVGGAAGLGELPGLAVERRGRAVRRQLLRLFRRLQERLDGAGAVVAPRAVVREERRALGRRGREARLQEERDPLVQLAPLPQEQPLIGDLLREALAEAILVACQEVLAVEDAAALQL